MPDQNLNDNLDGILRGAALVLGCNSANMVLYNPFTSQVSIRVGVASEQTPMILEVEQMLGLPLHGALFNVPAADKSLLFSSWPLHDIRDVASLADIVAGIFPAELTEEVEKVIGPRRFALVPIVRARGSYGVLIFEKAGDLPFSIQQREIMLRYADRIGDLIELGAIESAANQLEEAPDPSTVRLYCGPN